MVNENQEIFLQPERSKGRKLSIAFFLNNSKKVSSQSMGKQGNWTSKLENISKKLYLYNLYKLRSYGLLVKVSSNKSI